MVDVHYQLEKPVIQKGRDGEGLDYKRLAEEQTRCTETQAALGSSSLQIKNFQIDGSNLLCDV